MRPSPLGGDGEPTVGAHLAPVFDRDHALACRIIFGVIADFKGETLTPMDRRVFQTLRLCQFYGIHDRPLHARGNTSLNGLFIAGTCETDERMGHIRLAGLFAACGWRTID